MPKCRLQEHRGFLAIPSYTTVKVLGDCLKCISKEVYEPRDNILKITHSTIKDHSLSGDGSLPSSPSVRESQQQEADDADR